jgi:RsiW-degrading membrane proteinase PrsW (M82 family)
VSLFYATLLVLTTLIWGVVFYKKDYHPQPLKVVAQSFAVGLFSMVPVFAYKYLYQHFLPDLAEYQIFRPLLDSPVLLGLMVFGLNLVALSLVLFALGGALTLVLNFFNHSVLLNLKNAISQEPLGFTTVSLLLGAAIFLQKWLQGVWGSPALAVTLGSILFLAIIEEYMKHLIVRVTDDKKIKDIDDAITLSIMVGLAFSFVETIIYCVAVGEWKLVFYRSLVSLPVHVVASGIFGYYYGLAHFAKPIVGLEGGERTYQAPLWGMARHGWLHRLMTFKKSTVYSEEKIIEGFLFATLFHAVANVLFELSWGTLAVPLIVAGIAVVFRLYKTGQREDRLIAHGWPKKIRQEA